MPLPHFTNIDSHNQKWEPIFQNLYEVDILLPTVLAAIHPNATDLLLENTVSINFPTYKDLGTKEQRFKYSTREFLGMPEDTSFKDLTIKFNINQNDQKQMFTFRMMKDWYDLGWNNEDGTLHYKKNLVGTVIIYQHDKEGEIIRRVTCHNSQVKSFSGVETLDWGTADIMSLSVNLVSDYYEDWYY